MKLRAILIAVAALFLIIWGCGGGGGGGGTSGGGGGGNQGVVLNMNKAALAFGQIIGLSASVPGVGSQTISWSATGGTITPTGQSSATYTAPSTAGTFTVTATSFVDPTKTGTVVITVSAIGIQISPQTVSMGAGSTTTFTADVTGAADSATFRASAGTITNVPPNRASYTAPSTPGTYKVFASPTGSPALESEATVIVTAGGGGGNTATVSGRVVIEGTGTGINAVTVQFLNSQGAVLSQTNTGPDGSFTATVSTNATRFHILSSSLGSSYYKAYTYNGLRYSALIQTCSAPLPTLTSGGSVQLVTNVEIPQTTGPPPPPPNGCS